jgi:hypothetical protein
MSFSTIEDITILEDHVPESVSFTISNSESLTGIALSASSSNTLLVNKEQMFLMAGHQLVIRPEKNVSGTTLITLSGATIDNMTATTAFCLTVLSVNDPPSFISGDSIQITSTSEPQIFTTWAKEISAGTNESDQAVSFTLVTDLPHLFTRLPSIEPSGTLTFTPAPDASGSAEIAVYLKDDGGTENQGIDQSQTCYFTIDIIKPIIPPEFFITNHFPVVYEDSGVKTIQNFIAISNTTIDNQSLFFNVNTNHNALFELLPEISPIGLLSFKPAANAYGTARVDIVLNTDLQFISEPQSFTITILPVNDPPSFVPGINCLINEDAGLQTSAWASQIKSGPLNESDQLLEFIVQEIDRPDLFEILPTISSTGVLTYQIASNVHGVANVTVYLKDNGETLNNGLNVSDTQVFTIEILPVNDCPIFKIIPEITVSNKSGMTIIDNFLTDISMGANEPEQTGQFRVSTDNTALFEQLPTLSEDYQLNFSPNPYSTGTAMVLISLTDSGGTLYNGCQYYEQKMTINIEPQVYTLTLLIQGNGRLQVNDFIVSSPVWENLFMADQIVNIDAIPDDGWYFSHWSESLTQTTSDVSLIMSNNKILKAHFSQAPCQLTVKGKGWILLDQQYFKLPCSHDFTCGEVIALTALNGFSHWTDDLTGTSSSATLTMNTSKQVYAHFFNSDHWDASFQLVSLNADYSDPEVITEDDIIIGVNSEAESVLDIKPLQHTCQMFVFSSDEKEYLEKYIQMEGQDIYQWNIAIDPRGNTGDITGTFSARLSWLPHELHMDGQFQFIEGFDASGEVIIDEMTAENEYVITGTSVQFFTIRWIKNSYMFDLNAGWNLISLPLVPENPDLSVLFPDAEVAYVYRDGSYEIASQLEPGLGYWINIPSAETYIMYGEPFSEFSLPLSAGWHMLGALSKRTIPETNPENTLSVIFGFQNGAYMEVNEMMSAMGYWINVIEDSVITFK